MFLLEDLITQQQLEEQVVAQEVLEDQLQHRALAARTRRMQVLPNSITGSPVTYAAGGGGGARASPGGSGGSGGGGAGANK
jgi:uncharacterized membrane protein